MARFIKLICEFLRLKFAPRPSKGSRTVLLLFQSPQYYGTHTYFKNLTEYLHQRNLSMHLLAAEKEVDEAVSKVIARYNMAVTVFSKDEIYPIAWHKIHSWRGAYYFLCQALKQSVFLLRLYRRVNPVFTFISVGWPFMWFVGFLIPGKIYYVQNNMPQSPLDGGNRCLLKLGLLLNHPRVIAVSDFCRKNMAKYWGIPLARMDVVRYYYDGCYREHVSSEKIRVVSIARADDVKNPALWADIGNTITERRPNVVFTWAGDGNQLKQAMEKVIDPNRVQFLGYRNDVDDLYASADIFFTPAANETLGIAVVGAMFHGLPVIATSNGGTVESVFDGETGFIVDVTNREQMMDRLLRLIDDEALRREMGRKAKARFDAMFTKEMWVKKMDALVEE